MTTATAVFGHSYLWTRYYNTGASEAAHCLQAILKNALQDLRHADTWNRIGDSVVVLKETFQECSSYDWDGYGAKPLFAAAFSEGLAFLNALPPSIPLPGITPEPDGSIGFEWQNGPNKIFVASLSGKGSLVYAGLLGKGTKTHGTETFDDTIPRNIVENIQRLYS